MPDLSIKELWSTLWAHRFRTDAVRLRFELGGEAFDNITQPVPRFLQAHYRACAVSDAIFSDECVGVVACHERASTPVSIARTKSGFDALQSTGFRAPVVEEWTAAIYSDQSPDEDHIWTLRGYEMNHDKIARGAMLWHAIASEMPIYPSAPVVTFLIDPANYIMLHVYDDRGMDVIADKPENLLGAYHDFADWLLDYDRERMVKLF